MKQSRRFTLLLGFLVLTQVTIAQSAWTRGKGNGYIQMNYSTLPVYNQIHTNKDTPYYAGREILDVTIGLYGEYGITSRTTVLANMPIKVFSAGDPVKKANYNPLIKSGSANALGNISVGVRQQLFNSKLISSLQVDIEIPTGDLQKDLGFRSGYDAWSVSPTFNIGKGNNKYYWQAFTGFDIRTNDYSSNFKIGGEFGYTGIKKLILGLNLYNVISFQNGNYQDLDQSIQTGLYLNDQQYYAFTLKGIYLLTSHIGFNIGFGGAVGAQNVGSGIASTFGVFYSF